jgi:hypothetical protein
VSPSSSARHAHEVSAQTMASLNAMTRPGFLA